MNAAPTSATAHKPNAPEDALHDDLRDLDHAIASSLVDQWTAEGKTPKWAKKYTKRIELFRDELQSVEGLLAVAALEGWSSGEVEVPAWAHEHIEKSHQILDALDGLGHQAA